MCVTLWPPCRLGKQVIPFLIFMLLVVACGGDNQEAAPPTPATTPAAGGMVMPTPASTPAAAATTAVPVVTDPWLSGDRVQVLADEGLRLYSDASDDAFVMSVYTQGAYLTVLDPSGDYAMYPVDYAGRLWYRLRAPDGLVGWGAADQLSPVN